MPAAKAHDQPGKESPRGGPPPGAGAGSGPLDPGRQAIECIRHAIWQMRSTEDIHAVLQVMRTQLHQLGILYQTLGVNIVDPEIEEVTAKYLAHSSNTKDEKWTLRQEHDPAIRGGVIGDFWRKGEVVYRPDLHAEDRYGERGWADRHPGGMARCVVDVPFSHGTLALNSPLPGAFLPAHIQTFRGIAGVLSEGFRRLDDLRALERRAQEAEALAQAIAAVAGLQTLESIFQTVVREAARLAGTARAALLLYDEREGALVPRFVIGYDRELFCQLRLKPGEGSSGRVFQTGKPYVSTGVADPIWQTLGSPNRAILENALQGKVHPGGIVVPLIRAGQAIGTLGVTAGEGPLFSGVTKVLERLADQTVLAIERAGTVDRLAAELAAHQRLEEELRRSEERLRGAFGFAAIGMALVAPDGRFLRANQALCDIVGYSADELLALDFQSITHPDDLDADLDLVRQMLAGAIPYYHMEKRYFHRDGHTVWILLSVSLVRDEQDRPCYFISQIQDITARKQLEDQNRVDLGVQRVRNEVLRMQRQADWLQVVGVIHRELRELVEYNGCSIQCIEPDQQHFVYYTTYLPAEDPGQGQERLPLPSSLRKVLESKAPFYRRTRQEVVASGDLVASEVKCIVDVPFLGGTLAMSSNREEAFAERDIRVLGHFAQALSEAYRRQQDLKQLEAKEEQLRQGQKLAAVGQLTAGIAHNFNNLLQGILSNAEQCVGQVSDKAKESLADILRGTERAAALVRQLMLFSRRQFDAGYSPVDLGRLVEETVGICRRTFAARIALSTEVPAGLPPVLGDANQLTQVLLNLCVNARDALEEGEGPEPRLAVRLGVQSRSAAQVRGGRAEGDYLCLQVEDNGIGMDEATQARIFEPFFTTKAVDRGTGLGLATAYGIVRDHGGWIEFESTRGQGALFSCYLPLAAPGVKVEAAAESERKEEGADEGGGETVLVIDDDPLVRRILGMSLRRAGYTVLEGADGEVGVAIARREAVALVVMDWSMPGLSGQETLAALDQLNPLLPVIVCSGYLLDPEQAPGCAAILQKPVSGEGLKVVVRGVLRGARRGVQGS